MRILNFKSNKSGFTILEAVIAILILSMSLLLLMNMAMVSLDGNDGSNKTTNATQLIQEKLDLLRSTANPAGGNDVVNGVKRNGPFPMPVITFAALTLLFSGMISNCSRIQIQ